MLPAETGARPLSERCAGGLLLGVKSAPGNAGAPGCGEGRGGCRSVSSDWLSISPQWEPNLATDQGNAGREEAGKIRKK